MHTFWDLDKDGYEEPYVITIHKATKTVVRITARWCLDNVHRDPKGKIIRIDPTEYFTDFPFIPNPDGSIYAMGFGLLLGPLNESVNTIINQLVDAGTISNLQSGFIGKGLRLKMGMTPLQPGEWKVVNATGDDLQKSIFPLPIKEPSEVLLNLMNTLVTSGNQLASIAEIFVGKMPGQNTPATTTQDTIQQSMAVFTAIYKRVYRSLTEEYQKLYFLNKICPSVVEEESKVCGIMLQQSDYDLPDWTIIPAGDPSGDSVSSRASKMQVVGQLLSLGTIDPMMYTKTVLDANEIPNAQQMMRQPQPPPPDPKVQTEQLKQQGLQQKAQMDQQQAQLDQQGKQQELQMKEKEGALNAAMAQHKMQMEAQKQALDLQGKQAELRHNTVLQTIKQHGAMVEKAMHAAHAGQKHQLEMAQTQQMHQQTLQHQRQAGQQTLTLEAQRARQQAKAAKSKPSTE